MHPGKQDPLCERDSRIIRQARPRSCFGWVEAVQASNCKPNTGDSAASAESAAIEIGWLPRPAGHGRRQPYDLPSSIPGTVIGCCQTNKLQPTRTSAPASPALMLIGRSNSSKSGTVDVVSRSDRDSWLPKRMQSEGASSELPIGDVSTAAPAYRRSSPAARAHT